MAIDLNDAVFGVEVNEHLVHMAVVNQLANNRQGNTESKTRSEVSGGGKKTVETKRNRTCKTRFYKSSAVDRRWSGICSYTERVFFQDE